MSLQQQRILDLEYALAKQVPAMEFGFSIHTNYGDITIRAEHAPAITKAVKKAVERQLQALRKSQGGTP